MHLRILVLALLTTAFAFSAQVTVGTLQWVPVDGQWGYFVVLPDSGDPGDDVVDQIRLENLKLVIEVLNPDNITWHYRAFTLYPSWALLDVVDPNEEPGSTAWTTFSTASATAPGAVGSRKFEHPDFVPGYGDVRFLAANLNFSATPVVAQSSWTLSDGTEFLPNTLALGVDNLRVTNGGNLFPYAGSPLTWDLVVSGTAIPEPGTVGMAVAGIAAIFVARRRLAR